MVDDLVEPRNLVAGHAQVVPQPFGLRRRQFLQLAFHELEMDVQRVQRVADLVGDTGGEQRDRGKFFRFDGALGASARLRHVAQDDRHACHDGVFLVGNGHDVETEEPLLRIEHFQFVRVHLAPFVLVRRPDFLPIEVAQITRQRLADGAFGINAEELTRRGIQIGDAPFGIGHNHAFLNRVEERFQKALLAGELEDHALQALGINPLDPTDQFIEKGRLHSISRSSTLCNYVTMPVVFRL